MATPDVLKLRVILDEVNAEKLNLHSRPDTAQLYGEFHRITNQSLQYSFFAALDKNTPQLLKLYKERKTGAFGEKMADLLMAYGEQDKNDISATTTAALAGLPLYLKEDSSVIFKSCKEEEFEAFQEGAVALLGVVAEEDTAAGIPFQPLHVSVILEDQVVMTLRSWTDALVVLFSLIYAVNMSYPAKLSGFFEFIQVVL